MITLRLTKIPKLNLLVIKQLGGNLFLASQDSIVIDEDGFYELLFNLLNNKMLDPRKVETLLHMGDF